MVFLTDIKNLSYALFQTKWYTHISMDAYKGSKKLK